MIAFSMASDNLVDNIFIPKYYDTQLVADMNNLDSEFERLNIGQLIDDGVISVATGHEVGKMAYGTGDIPFIRTSDISNWELKTVPKQGISKDIYEVYAEKQDVRAGDILMVRDGSYLIGSTCQITELDIPMLYQSHILKFRVIDTDFLDPNLFFAALNSPIVQRQIRSKQFTADIIDTIGNRYTEIDIFIPRQTTVKLGSDGISKEGVALDIQNAQSERLRSRLMIKQFPKLIEESLFVSSSKPFDCFLALDDEDAFAVSVSDTSTLELGRTTFFAMASSDIVDNIYIPKYYSPEIAEEMKDVSGSCDLISIGELVSLGVLSLSTGDEIGKMAYGTGDIPFIRTSDFSNWELKHEAKHCISEEIYAQYAAKQDVCSGDILLVRDGSYLIGTTCLLTDADTKMLFCGGLIKIRSNDHESLSPYLLLGLLNSYLVKRQIRSKQFTRDIIDTLGTRLVEVMLPIPKSAELKRVIEDRVRGIINMRVRARASIKNTAQLLS